MSLFSTPFWKKTPFLKLLIALIAGILLQWQLQLPVVLSWSVLLTSIFLLGGLFFIPVAKRYRFGFIAGLAITTLFLSAGALLTWHQDIRNDANWFGTIYKNNDAVFLTLNEPIAEKTNSFKATATVSAIIKGDTVFATKGNIILYFQKEKEDSSAPALQYGSTILIKKPLQEIKNSGNPGGFDYKRYSLFQGITHQVFLKKDEYQIIPGTRQTWLKHFLYSSREKVLDILRRNVTGKKEAGLAEALLIGYKDDLDQSLVQSYTNTGVVHIIAISGLHLGLIYWLLVMLCKPLKKSKKLRWVGPFLIITGLWIFSLLAGAQPSVLRSALMFTCIVLGDCFSRKTSVYNTMAASAFLLLCYDPFWLWDVGFQLSYAAVLSIIIFFRPVYNLFYIKNKLLDNIWKLNAVTISAQLLTIPISIYHFHQFPNYFLLTNFIAVPLSSAIVLGEILLCSISFIPFLASLTGKLLVWLIWLMNTYIERVENIPYSLLDGLQVSIAQTLLLTLFISAMAYWLMEKSNKALKFSLISLLLFTCLRSASFTRAENQRKIIVYNVPRKKAIDFIDGPGYIFVGDSGLLKNDFLRNFHLKPSRILHRINEVQNQDGLFVHDNYVDFYGRHILLLDTTAYFSTSLVKPVIDLLVISKNPKIYMKKIAASLTIKQIVFDGSVPAYKLSYWKKDCDSLHIPWHDAALQGAFVMSLN